MLDHATKALRRSAALAAGTALMTFAVPVAAEAPAAQAGVTAAAASTTSAAAPAKAKKANGERKYCVTTEFTGSRISKKTCKTKSEWAAEGTDIDEFTK